MRNENAAIILTRSDVKKLASVTDYHSAVAAAFHAHGEGLVHSPPPIEIDGVEGAFHGKGASMTLGGERLAALKLNGNFPFNNERFGLPTIQGATLLCNAETGALLAILDSIEITLRRTAAASAVAMEALARTDAESLLICGCGAQARAHVEALASLKKFTSIGCYDVDAARSARFVNELSADGVPCEIVHDLSDAARRADVIATLTPSKTPILGIDDVKPGAFIAAVGADNPTKNEIAPALMKQAVVIADVKEQSVAMGDMRAGVGSGVIDVSHIRAELGAVLTGRTEGRRNSDEIVIFDSTGAAFQDLAAAALIAVRARSAGVGIHVNLAG